MDQRVIIPTYSVEIEIDKEKEKVIVYSTPTVNTTRYTDYAQEMSFQDTM